MEWSWCKEFCPEMATYNKVYKIKRGKGLLNHIKLVGDKKQVKYCEKKEREYFAQTNVGAEGMSITDQKMFLMCQNAGSQINMAK